MDGTLTESITFHLMDSNKRSILTVLSWASLDFANTGFYVIIITPVFPVYFNNVIAGGNESYLGRTASKHRKYG